MFYADDSCVIAASPSGLQGLLNIFTKFDLENDVESCVEPYKVVMYDLQNTWLSSEMSIYLYEFKQ